MLEKDRGGLCKAPTKVERRKCKAKRRKRNPIKCIDLRFERLEEKGNHIIMINS